MPSEIIQVQFLIFLNLTNPFQLSKIIMLIIKTSLLVGILVMIFELEISNNNNFKVFHGFHSSNIRNKENNINIHLRKNLIF